ncbi:MAG: TolC family protein [Candidatus Pedobacter colombiensis]|uniref:TolC family protein n=1 Tax=Candidatus Pedobacter colombiensis TaxID=3121371 RepID=A0AAJ5W4S5_9SPHI|nr:TolC family protein [Pedobacter sp.]WEK18126.1 MAG: TolC family protein [Pedobacter sp.]
MLEMKSLCFAILICFVCYQTNAQNKEQLSIEECYKLARQNYPLIQQAELIQKTAAYSIENAGKGYLPQFNISGQASYQSDVTKIPIQIPGINIPILSKDQYRLSAEGTQVLFDGGTIKQQKSEIASNAVVESQQLEVELYKLKDRINQLFFGILLINAQLKQNEFLKRDIQLGIDKTKATIANGAAFKSSLDMLKAELLKVAQQGTELRYTRKGYIDVLGLFIHQPFTEEVNLVTPVKPVIQSEIRRPELGLYDSQRKSMDVKKQGISIRNLPKFNLFLQGGVGRPALNMLDNSVEPFAIGGLRMSWLLSGFYTSKREKAIIAINIKEIDIQSENFLLNTRFTLKQQDAEIDKQTNLLTTDDEIIALRTSVKKTSAAQLEYGVINTSDYLREVNAEDQARQSKILHEIQLLMAQYNKQTTLGN